MIQIKGTLNYFSQLWDVIRRFLFLAILICFSRQSGAQHSDALFDDSRVSSVYIQLPADSLAWLYTNVQSDQYLKSRFIFDDGTARDTLENVGMRLRGNTSRYAQKKSFKLSFNQFVSGRKYQGVKKLNLNGQHNDPTMIREKLFYDTWNRCGLAARRTTFVKVYINQTYFGLYTGLEEMDKDWLARVFPENDGNLYKCTYPADLKYLGTSQLAYKNVGAGTATGGRAYDLQTNETEDDYSDFVQLVTALQAPNNAQFAAGIQQKLNVNGYLKALAMDVASGNWDNYAYNKNNFFLYHNLATGKFEFITYDTDNTFGVDWMGIDWATRLATNWIHPTEPRPLATKLLAVPEFKTQYYHYLDSITRFVVEPDSIFPRIDAMKMLITPAATNDTYRTLDYGYTMTEFSLGFNGTVDGHTPYGIKPFLGTRSQSTLAQIPTVGVLPTESRSTQYKISPNPAQTFIDIQLPDNSALSGELILSDLMGRKLKAWSWEDGKIHMKVDLLDVQSGVYLLQVPGGAVVKIIKD